MRATSYVFEIRRSLAQDRRAIRDLDASPRALECQVRCEICSNRGMPPVEVQFDRWDGDGYVIRGTTSTVLSRREVQELLDETSAKFGLAGIISPVRGISDPHESPRSPSRPTIYTASRTVHAHMWRTLRAEGYRINASWIDEAGEGETADYAELAQRCIDEACAADLVLLYCESGDLLKGALIEIGAALAVGRTIRCVGHCSSISRVFRKHRNWHEFASIREALRDA